MKTDKENLTLSVPANTKDGLTKIAEEAKPPTSVNRLASWVLIEWMKQNHPDSYAQYVERQSVVDI